MISHPSRRRSRFYLEGTYGLMSVMALAAHLNDFESGHGSNKELYYEVHTSLERRKYIIPNLSKCEVLGA